MPRDSNERTTQRLSNRISRLSQQQQLWLCCFLSNLINGDPTVALIEQARTPACCPHCRHGAIQRYGTANQMQRYRCAACRRTFNALTGTPLARLRHKTRWLAYCKCLLDPASTIASAAQYTGVHRNTSFRWRHRFLDWIKRDRPVKLQGIVEVETASIRQSNKGLRQLDRPPYRRGISRTAAIPEREAVHIFTARDRAGKTIDWHSSPGAVTSPSLMRPLLAGLDRDVLLVFEQRQACKEFAVHAGISHHAIDPCRSIDSRSTMQHIHLRNATSYQGRFSVWARHFRGVATRYLDHYWGWHWAIDRGRLSSAEALLRAALGVFNSQR